MLRRLSLKGITWTAGESNSSRAVCRTAPHTGGVRPMRRELGNRTPCVLIPNQARSPCRTLPNGQPSDTRAGLSCHPLWNFQCSCAPACWGLRRSDRIRTCNRPLWRRLRYQLRHTPVGSWSETRNAARSRSGRAASAMLLRLRPPPTHVVPALGFIGRRVAEPGHHRGQHGKRHPRQRGLRARPRQHDDLLRTGAVCAGDKYGSGPLRWSTG